MISRLPPALRGTFTGTVLALNTLLLTLAMVPAAAVKFAIRATAVRRVCDRVLIALASTWVAINNAWIAAASPAPWDVQGVDGAGGLREDAWYLVSSNHRSWVDIVVLQRVLHGRVPFLKFFLKQELIWVPVIGWAWWALDFPFLKRGKGAGAQRSDLTAAREACEKFKHVPTSVINFLEGTRYSDAKRDEQGSPYRHLLKPKIGGLGIALATMGGMFESMIDVTIVYPNGTPTFADLLCGRVGTVHVRVSQVPIPADLIGGDPIMDRAYRRRLTSWVDVQWAAKDALIERLTVEDQKVHASAA